MNFSLVPEAIFITGEGPGTEAAWVGCFDRLANSLKVSRRLAVSSERALFGKGSTADLTEKRLPCSFRGWTIFVMMFDDFFEGPLWERMVMMCEYRRLLSRSRWRAVMMCECRRSLSASRRLVHGGLYSESFRVAEDEEKSARREKGRGKTY